MSRSKIPIKAAKALAEQYSLDQVIVLAWDRNKNVTHVTTYGKTPDDCVQAAQGGNRVKRALGWPDTLCDARPAQNRGQKLYRLKPGCSACINNIGDMRMSGPEIGPTFTVDWSFSGPLGDVDCYEAVDASGRKGFVFREDVEEVR